MAIIEGRWTGPIWDTHLHLDPNGRGIAAAQDFANAGGTHLCLVHKPDFHFGLPESIPAVKEAYMATLDMAKVVRRETGLDVRVILGPHPVVWEKQVHILGLEASTQLHLDSVALALEYCAGVMLSLWVKWGALIIQFQMIFGMRQINSCTPSCIWHLRQKFPSSCT